MIKQDTARDIFNCYAEIISTENMLSEIEKQEKDLAEQREKACVEHDDLAKNHLCSFQLAVPSSFSSESRGHRLYYLNPAMAKAVIASHQASQKARLVELNERAKIEANTEDANVTKAN